MDRRGFLVRTGLSLAASAFATWSDAPAPQAQIVDWDAVRGMFSVSPAYLHFGGLYLASHPTLLFPAVTNGYLARAARGWSGAAETLRGQIDEGDRPAFSGVPIRRVQSPGIQSFDVGSGCAE